MQTTLRIFAYSSVAVLLSFGLDDSSQAKASKTAIDLLRGQIITSMQEIDVPSRESNFVRKLLNQDHVQIARDESGRWVIHFVAFFGHPLPVDRVGVVVLDAKGDPIAMAEIPAELGQTNLVSFVTVDATETPEQAHTLQLYYAKGNKPIVLAKKPIILK